MKHSEIEKGTYDGVYFSKVTRLKSAKTSAEMFFRSFFRRTPPKEASEIFTRVKGSRNVFAASSAKYEMVTMITACLRSQRELFFRTDFLTSYPKFTGRRHQQVIFFRKVTTTDYPF